MDSRTLEYILKVKDNASRAFRNVGKNAVSSFSRMKSAIFSVKTALVGLATYLITRYISAWIKAAARQEDAIQGVLAMARAQGSAYAGLREEVEKTTSALQRKTTFGDEEQMEAMVRMQAAGVKVKDAMAALPLVLNMAASRQMQAAQAAEYLARGMMGNLALLKRLYPEMYKWNAEQLTWANVQKYLADKLGDTSEALARTPFGKMKQIGNLWGDIKEKFGGFIALWLQKQGAFEAISEILDAISGRLQDVKKDAEDAKPPTKTLGILMYDLAIAIRRVQLVFQGLAERRDDMRRFGDNVAEVVRTIPGLQWLAKLGKETDYQVRRLADGGYGLGGAWDYAETQGDPLLRTLLDGKNAMMKFTPEVEKITDAFVHLGDAGEDAAEKITEAVELMNRTTLGRKPDLIYLWRGMSEKVDAVKEKVDHLSEATIFLGNVMSQAFVQAKSDAQKFLQFLSRVLDMIRAISMAMKGVSGAGWGIAGAAIGILGSLIPTQHGYSGMVTQPTLFLAGERGPEHVQVTPQGGAAPVRVEIFTSDPATYARIVSADPNAQDIFYRDVVYPAIEREGRR